MIKTPKAIKKVTDWYAERANSWPKDSKSTEEKDTEDAIDKFGKQHYGGAELLRDLRVKHAPPHWKKRGPNPKSK